MANAKSWLTARAAEMCVIAAKPVNTTAVWRLANVFFHNSRQYLSLKQIVLGKANATSRSRSSLKVLTLFTTTRTIGRVRDSWRSRGHADSSSGEPTDTTCVKIAACSHACG